MYLVTGGVQEVQSEEKSAGRREDSEILLDFLKALFQQTGHLGHMVEICVSTSAGHLHSRFVLDFFFSA